MQFQHCGIKNLQNIMTWPNCAKKKTIKLKNYLKKYEQIH